MKFQRAALTMSDLAKREKGLDEYENDHDKSLTCSRTCNGILSRVTQRTEADNE